jgi:hypothetical protein
MKQNLILILTILLCACGSNTNQKDSNTEKIINILDKHDYLKSKLEFHKDKEVKIYDVGLLDPNDTQNYALYVYRKGVGQTGNFIFWAHNKYDKAAYKWVNDTTLKLRLFNSSNNFSDSYTYTYHRNGGEFGMNRN